MSDLKLDESTGDLVLENGDIPLTEGIDAVRQVLQQNLSAFLGEWFLDQDLGVPYYQDILKKNPDPVLLDGIFKKVILKTPGIIQLNTFDITYDTKLRKFNLDFEAQSKNGVIDFNLSLGG